MPRLAALLSLVLLLAACDSTEPGDDLVGTWTLTSMARELRVTSRMAQTVPDFSATPTGAITVSGAASSRLDRLDAIYRDDHHAQVQLSSSTVSSQSGGSSWLAFYQSGSDTSADFYDAEQGAYFSGYVSGRELFTVSGTRFTVSPMTLGGGGPSVSVGGTLTFPGVALAAGEPTAIPRAGYVDETEGTVTFEFEDDGTFVTTEIDGNTSVASSGTWEVADDGRVRIGVVDGSVTQYVTFDYAITGGTLQLEAAGLDGLSSCDAECLRQVESEVFAARGTLSAAELVTAFRLRSGGPRAAARADARAAEAPDRPARRFSPTVPLLGGR